MDLGHCLDVLGRVLVPTTDRGIAAGKLGDREAELAAELTCDFPKATLHRDPRGLPSGNHRLFS